MNESDQQLYLVADPRLVASKVRPVKKKIVERAHELPIAVVRVDVSVAHLDRDFDYFVPAALDAEVNPGVRVRVRFNRTLVDAIVIRRTATSEFDRIAPVERVIGPALTPDTMNLVSAVCERYVGLFWDVVRAAVPAKHGKAGSKESPRSDDSETGLAKEDEPFNPDPSVWNNYMQGGWLNEELKASRPIRAVWTSAPASDWCAEISALVGAVCPTGSDNGVLVLLPDAAKVKRLHKELPHAQILIAESGAKERYESFLRIYGGSRRVVIGTRSAVFAPVKNLKAIVMWDDFNDAFADPHAPYWDAREVAALRSHRENVSLIVGSVSRSVATQSWCDSGWARSVVPSDSVVAGVRGHITAIQDSDYERDPIRARIPHIAWAAAQRALKNGPVLFQVARKGYIPVVVCASCGVRAQCPCGGEITMTRLGTEVVSRCARCGSTTWHCDCGGMSTKAVGIGAERTAEELGRAFPGLPVLWSQSEHMVSRVDNQPRLVVCTPGAEPSAVGGFRAIVILDPTTSRISLTAHESLVHRFFNAAVLAAPQAPIVIAGNSDERAIQALLRWDSVWFANREILDRTEARLPPFARVAQLDGSWTGVNEVVTDLRKVVGQYILGPIEIERDGPHEKFGRAFVVTPRNLFIEVSHSLAEITRKRSADAQKSHVQVRVDPRDF